MTTFTDENKTLEFSFGENQEVFQYDLSRFYREKIEKYNSGIKAVDFLCRDNSCCKSFLIEAKCFRNLKGDDAKAKKGAEVAEELAVEISRKVFDTISGLYVATFSPQCDDEEKSFARQFLAYPLHVVFHYELPRKWGEEMRKLRMADMKARLKRKLQIIDPTLRVENSLTAKYWNVTRKDA